MASYITLTTTRTTPPDPIALRAALVSAMSDPAAVLVTTDGRTWTGKKSTTWTAPQITTAQSVLDTAPTLTPQLLAQHAIDAFPIEYRALVLALVDALNVVRAGLPTPLPPITPAQALNAIRAKAGTL